MFGKRLSKQLSEQRVKNVHGPISFHLLKKGDKKLYLFGDRHYKHPGSCPSSQNIVSLLNDIKERHNLFVEGNCREIRNFELTNYICEILQKVKQSETRNIFYSDRRYSHIPFILNVMTMLDSLVEKNMMIFLRSFYEYKYDLDEDDDEDDETKTNEYKTEAVLTDFREGSNLTDIDNILTKLSKEDFNSFMLLNDYGVEMTENFNETEFKNIIKMAENIFDDIYKKNKIKDERIDDFVERLNNIWIKTKDLNFVNSRIKLSQTVNNYLQDDEINKKIIHTKVQIAQTAGIYMDIYLLANFLLSDINNNVVYAGDFHIRAYVHLLKQLGFTEEFSYKAPKMVFESKKDYYQHHEQCTPLGNTKLPLFSFK